MNLRSLLTRLSLILLVIALVACGAKKEAATPTPDAKLVLTAAAETAMVRLTQAGAQATLTPSMTPGSPTPELALTAAFGTVSAQFTQQARLTPSPSPTQAATMATATLSNQVERALYVADVTIPDGTDFAPGATFTKTWRLKNSGSSTWTPAYSLVFISGEKMGGPDKVSLPNAVTPGNTVDISVNLVAPSSPGTYRGYWKIFSATGKFVDDPVYVEIDVIQNISVTPSGATPTATTQSGTVSVTDITMAVDSNSYSGACPHTFTFTGRFTLNQPSSVTYKVEAGSDTPGFTFNLPAPQTNSFPAGKQSLTFTFEFTQSVSGWMRLHITSPVNEPSADTSFSLTCQP